MKGARCRGLPVSIQRQARERASETETEAHAARTVVAGGGGGVQSARGRGGRWLSLSHYVQSKLANIVFTLALDDK